MPKRTKLNLLLDNALAMSLKDRLAEEFRHPQEKDPEPVIVEDRSPSGGLRVWVVWKAWAGLPSRDRSEIISEAYREALLMNPPLVFAVGLTPEEAKTMNLTYA